MKKAQIVEHLKNGATLRVSKLSTPNVYSIYLPKESRSQQIGGQSASKMLKSLSEKRIGLGLYEYTLNAVVNAPKKAVRRTKSPDPCTCRECGTTYDRRETARIYGKVSSVHVGLFCSAQCFTKFTTESK